jgi:hypothetical protein
MFYNGFTLLMQLLAGTVAYLVGNHYGYNRGETDMYERCRRAEETRRKVMPWLGE